MKNGGRTYLFASLTILTLAALVLGFWQLYPYPEYRTVYYDDVRPVLNCPCKPGDTVEHLVRGERYTTITATITRELIGQTEGTIVIAFPSVQQTAEAGPFERINSSVTIPPNTPPGEYIIQTTIVVQVNPIRALVQVYQTEPFEVIAP